jgi:hypothetical protein
MDIRSVFSDMKHAEIQMDKNYLSHMHSCHVFCEKMKWNSGQMEV